MLKLLNAHIEDSSYFSLGQTIKLQGFRILEVYYFRTIYLKVWLGNWFVSLSWNLLNTRPVVTYLCLKPGQCGEETTKPSERDVCKTTVVESRKTPRW